MGVEIDLSKTIMAPPEVVWSLLSSPSSWSTWWKECENARLMDNRSLREGSVIEMVVKPAGGAAVSLLPTADLVTENRTLSLTHRSGLMQLTCVWYLNGRNAKVGVKTEVRSQLVMEGWMTWLARLSGRANQVHIALEGQLRALKRYSERLHG